MTNESQEDPEEGVGDLMKIFMYLTAYKSYYLIKTISSSMNKKMSKEEVESFVRKLKYDIGFTVSEKDFTSGDSVMTDNILNEYEQFKKIKAIGNKVTSEGAIEAFCEYVYNAKEYVGITPENVVYYPFYLSLYTKYLAKMISKKELEASFIRRESDGEFRKPSFSVVRRDIVRCVEVMNEIQQKMKK